jgi:uncharacterized protein YdaU (DUF1376 family)
MKIASFSIADYCEATAGMPHEVERLYFRMLMKMLSRESGLPDDDRDNSRTFGYDIRAYRKLKAKLLAWPNAIYIEDGLLKNARIEADLVEYRERRGQAAKNGSRGGIAKAQAGEDRPGSSAEVQPKFDGSSPEVRPKSPPISYTTVAENNDLPLASPSPSPSPSPLDTTGEGGVSSTARGAVLRFDLAVLSRRLFEAADGALASEAVAPGLAAMTIPQMWIDSGADLERDILPTVCAIAAKRRGARIKTWNYFTDAIAEAKAVRERGLPEVSATASAASTSGGMPAWRAEQKRRWEEGQAALRAPVETAWRVPA